MQRQRRLGGRRTPRRRRSFMNCGQLDASDADVHFGGLGGGMPMRARCSRGPRGRHGREHGRRDEARRDRNQRRGCRLASRCNGFCRLERDRPGQRGPPRLRVRRRSRGARGKWRVVRVVVARIIVPVWNEEGRHRVGCRFAPHGPIGRVRAVPPLKQPASRQAASRSGRPPAVRTSPAKRHKAAAPPIAPARSRPSARAERLRKKPLMPSPSPDRPRAAAR